MSATLLVLLALVVASSGLPLDPEATIFVICWWVCSAILVQGCISLNLRKLSRGGGGGGGMVGTVHVVCPGVPYWRSEFATAQRAKMCAEKKVTIKLDCCLDVLMLMLRLLCFNITWHITQCVMQWYIPHCCNSCFCQPLSAGGVLTGIVIEVFQGL
jgi:hypothetical protein